MNLLQVAWFRPIPTKTPPIHSVFALALAASFVSSNLPGSVPRMVPRKFREVPRSSENTILRQAVCLHFAKIRRPFSSEKVPRSSESSEVLRLAPTFTILARNYQNELALRISKPILSEFAFCGRFWRILPKIRDNKVKPEMPG